MKHLFILAFIILFPFLLNAWHGYLKPARKSEIQHIDCSYIQGKLRPYTDDIIKVTESQGNTLKSMAGEGYKIVRNEMKKHLPSVYTIIEDYVSTLSYKGAKPMDCDKEKYCWFLRLYNKNGHFLDWHFDNNFTSGARYTLVCNIHVSPCNTSHFMTKERVVPSESGSGVIYNGTDVKHAISSQSDDCTRIALIVPMYENDQITLLGRWRKWARDISFQNLKL